MTSKPHRQDEVGQRRYDAMHRRILNTTIHLLEMYVPAQITERMIYQSAGIARATFYNHFTSAQEAVTATKSPN